MRSHSIDTSNNTDGSSSKRRVDSIKIWDSSVPTNHDDSNSARDSDGVDPLLSIIGIFSSGELNDVAQDKYRYLAEAYLAEFSDSDTDE